MAALTDAEVEYALCGGLAVNVYGHVRATMDIDVLVPSSEVDRALGALRPLGYSFDAGAIPFDVGTPKAREVRRISRVEGGDFLSVDLLVVTPVFEGVWSSRTRVTWNGRSLPIVSREGLLAMKRVASRAQDLADIERLEELGDDDR